MKTTKNDIYVLEKLSKKERATATAAATAEEFPQSIQVPSSTHPGTTYPVRTSPHSDIYIYIYIYIYNNNRSHFGSSLTPALWRLGLGGGLVCALFGSSHF